MVEAAELASDVATLVDVAIHAMIGMRRIMEQLMVFYCCNQLHLLGQRQKF